MSEIMKVDAIGDTCPIPVVKAKKALDQATEDTVVEVHVDNEIAVQNLMKMAKSQRCASQSQKEGEKHFVVSMWRNKAAAGMGQGDAEQTGAEQNGAGQPGAGQPDTQPGEEQELSCHPDARTHQIVVIASSTMGGGNDSLGAVLMKGFLYALSQMDSLPEKILFYNGGVKWTTEESEVLDDLKSMEAQGVEIFSCGTCLDYYRCSDKLLVGEVTNMYSIVEAMMAADKIIKP